MIERQQERRFAVWRTMLALPLLAACMSVGACRPPVLYPTSMVGQTVLKADCGPLADLSSLDFSPDGRRLVVGNSRGEVIVYDVESRREVWRRKVYMMHLRRVAFSKTEDTILVAGKRVGLGTVLMFDLTTNKVRNAFTPEAPWFDSEREIWPLDTPHREPYVRDLFTTEDGSFFSYCGDKFVKFDYRKGLQADFPSVTKCRGLLDVSSDGEVVMVLGGEIADGNGRGNDDVAGNQAVTSSGHSRSKAAGVTLLSGKDYEKKQSIWFPDRVIMAHAGSLSPAKDRIAFIVRVRREPDRPNDSIHLRVHSATLGSLEFDYVLGPLYHGSENVASSPDGRLIYCERGSYLFGKQILVFDAELRKCLGKLRGHRPWLVKELAVSPCGKWVATCCGDQVYIWSTARFYRKLKSKPSMN